MGLFKRISEMIGGTPPETQQAGASTTVEHKEAAATVAPASLNGFSHANGQQTATATLDPDDTADLDPEDTVDLPARHAVVRNPPKTKQELLEELRKNYTEVVELVRKVDTHLDREQHRSERVMEVVERFDRLMPTLENMSSDLTTHATKLNAQLIEALERTNAANAQAVSTSVGGVAEQLARTSEDQARLVHTMAEFRETIHSLAESSVRTDQTVRSITQANVEREQSLAELIQSGRKAQFVAIGVALTMGLCAMGLAIMGLSM